MDERAFSPAEAVRGTAALANQADFRLGDVTVQPSLRSVIGPSGSARGEPKVIQVLLALVHARGAVLSRDALLQECWNGRIVGEDAINRAVSEVRRIVAAVGGSIDVETVPRIGYRLVGVDWSKQDEAAVAGATPTADRRKMMLAGAAAVAVLAGGAGAVWLGTRNEDVDSLIDQGRLLQGAGAADGDRRAERLFREALRRDPARADAWGWLAVVLPDYDQSRDAAQRALTLDSAEPNARAVLAYQSRDLEAWTVWEDALLQVLDDAPDNAFALNQLTFFYQGMGRCLDSWRTNERACTAEPFNPIPLHRRALKHWIFGRIGDADKVAERSLQLWPRNPMVWNARMLIYAFTSRAPAAQALLEDAASRPANLTAPSLASWRAALAALATGAPADIATALATCTAAAKLAPGLAANAIMVFSHLGELDAAYRVADGLFEAKGPVVQQKRGSGIRDLYSASSWGRTQFLFIPATAPFRSDARFPDLCRRIGHADYWRKRGIWPDPAVRGALDPAKLA